MPKSDKSARTKGIFKLYNLYLCRSIPNFIQQFCAVIAGINQSDPVFIVGISSQL